MKPKTLLTLSSSVAAGISASAAVQHTVLDAPMTIHVDDDIGINFYLSEGFAEESNSGATTPGEFRLSFWNSESDKARIDSNLFSTNGIRGTNTHAEKLDHGTLISGSDPYQPYAYLRYQASGQFSRGTRGYVGLRFIESGTTYYGWADVAYTRNREIVLYSFAYEDSGAPIYAGTVIPEPKSAALLAALLSGSAILYRRRQKNANG
ncbi:MAG TPA: hypothetical protein VK041_10385 [Opitutales bacterium]|nr:hypothetical protein [Opitutales bacterium]